MKTYFVRGIKHLFYIIFCDFNFCCPELTAEYRRNYRLCSIYILNVEFFCINNNLQKKLHKFCHKISIEGSLYIDSPSFNWITIFLHSRFKNLTFASGEIWKSTGSRRRICFSYNQNKAANFRC